MPSRSGPNTGTTTPSPSSGTRPPKRSSQKSAADEPPSTRSNPRRTTSGQGRRLDTFRRGCGCRRVDARACGGHRQEGLAKPQLFADLRADRSTIRSRTNTMTPIPADTTFRSNLRNRLGLGSIGPSSSAQLGDERLIRLRHPNEAVRGDDVVDVRSVEPHRRDDLARFG